MGGGRGGCVEGEMGRGHSSGDPLRRRSTAPETPPAERERGVGWCTLRRRGA